MFGDLSFSIPFKVKGDEDDHGGFVRPDDNLLAYDVSGLLLVEAENGNTLRHPRPTGLTFSSAYALVVGSIIGAGIFSSPSRVDNSTPSPGVAMLIWLAAGLVAWAGAVAFAELGSAIPRNGGMQEYLRYIYGDSVASVMSRTSILASRPTSLAVLSIVFAEYWTTMIFPSEASSGWVTKPLAIATVLCVLAINCISASISTRFTNVLLVSKLSTVALILMMALLVGAFNVSVDEEPNRDWSSKDWFTVRLKGVGAGTIDWTDISTWDLLGQLTSAMYAALWACSGFDSINIVVAEMKDPSRDLPRIVHLAMPTVLCCYLLTNMAYYIVIPWDELSASTAIAVIVGNKTLGPIAGLVFAILVSVSVFGVMNIEVYTGGILTETAARHGYMPKFLARSANDDRAHHGDAHAHEGMNSTTVLERVNRFLGRGLHVHLMNTPIKAMAFNTALAMPYILLGSFKPLVTFSGVAISTFFFLTVSGGLMLRFREPSLKRPYQPNFLIPVIFCAASFLLVVRSVILAPLQGLALLLLIGLGVVLHHYRHRLGNGNMGSPTARYVDER